MMSLKTIVARAQASGSRCKQSALRFTRTPSTTFSGEHDTIYHQFPVYNKGNSPFADLPSIDMTPYLHPQGSSEAIQYPSDLSDLIVAASLNKHNTSSEAQVSESESDSDPQSPEPSPLFSVEEDEDDSDASSISSTSSEDLWYHALDHSYIEGEVLLLSPQLSGSNIKTEGLDLKETSQVAVIIQTTSAVSPLSPLAAAVTINDNKHDISDGQAALYLKIVRTQPRANDVPCDRRIGGASYEIFPRSSCSSSVHRASAAQRRSDEIQMLARLKAIKQLSVAPLDPTQHPAPVGMVRPSVLNGRGISSPLRGSWVD